MLLSLPVVAFPLAAFSNLALRHFYVLGAFWGDSGTLAYLLSGRFIKLLRSFVWLGFGCPGNARLPLWVTVKPSA